jgi:hypothetical protein
MVDVIVLNEPSGTVFRNSSERNACLVRVARRLDGDESYSRWWIARSEYTQCQGLTTPGAETPVPHLDEAGCENERSHRVDRRTLSRFCGTRQRFI